MWHEWYDSNHIRNDDRVNLPEITIAEDDVLFKGDSAFKYYQQNKPLTFDLYLGGITYGELMPENTVKDFAGTHLFTIHQNFYSPFLDQNGEIDIDRALKNKGRFVVCNPMIAIQRNGFSDNRQKVMDYSIYFKGRMCMLYLLEHACYLFEVD